MPFKIIEYGKDDTKACIALYGQNGIGKTHLAGTAPGKKLFLDAGGNTETLLKFPSNEWVAVEHPTKFNDMVKMWSDPFLDEFDVIVCDNLTGVNRILVVESVNSFDFKRVTPGIPAQADYMLAAERLRSYCSSLKERRSKQHVIAICHEKIEKDELTGALVGGPSVPGQVPAHVMSLFGEILYLAKNKMGIRCAYTSAKGFFPAATRVLDIDKEYPNPNLKELYPKFFGV